jgi:lipoprotein-anchoring transpeptidase ErfK/SrfK
MKGTGNVSTDKTRIFVPLDYSIEPQILPQYLSYAAKHEKFILINRRLQYIGLYEWGKLTHIFPISSGASKGTPKRDFVVNYMDEEHYSKKFDSPMDHALNIGGDYFIHEGIVPGYAASHGCIRLFPLDARFLFYHWAKPGIPGKVTD